jgi:hypothetical protein
VGEQEEKAMKAKRGKCPACGYRFRLRADGRLMTHTLYLGSVPFRCPVYTLRGAPRVTDPVCEPAQVEERHRERMRRTLERFWSPLSDKDQNTLALAFSEQERETWDAAAKYHDGQTAACQKMVFRYQHEGSRHAAAAHEVSAAMFRDPDVRADLLAALRATPGGEREEGGG